MATTKYNDEKRIVLFRNDKFGEKDQPVYRGNVTVEGKKYNISVWAKLDNNNKMYLQGVLQLPEEANKDANKQAELELEEIEKAIQVDA